MKESKLIQMQNKVESLGRVMQQVIYELEQLKTLSIGNMELVKELPGYQEAFEALKKKNEQSESDTVGTDRPHEVREVSPEQGEA